MFNRAVHGKLILVGRITAVGGSQTERLGLSFINKAVGVGAIAGDDRRGGVSTGAGVNRDSVGIADV